MTFFFYTGKVLPGLQGGVLIPASKMAAKVGIEPTTVKLTASRSAAELHRNENGSLRGTRTPDTQDVNLLF